jgi:hypothetical protein
VTWNADTLEVTFFVKCNASETHRKLVQHLNIPSSDNQLSMMKIKHNADISNKGYLEKINMNFNTLRPVSILILKSPVPAYFKGDEQNVESMLFPVIKIQNFYTP